MMNIQSLSIHVPNNTCINKCKFCVSRMRKDEYKFIKDEKEYKKRLEFARDNGCNTVMLTGTSEPQQNKEFLKWFSDINKSLPSPFKIIEIQTTGFMLDKNYLEFLKDEVGVTTISLSVSFLFDENKNNEIIGNKINLYTLIDLIKSYDFNLRLSLNMISEYEKQLIFPQDIFNFAKTKQVDQLTFRVLYSSGKDTPQDKWISENKASKEYIANIQNYIREKGKPLHILEYGQTQYDVDGISVVLDDDCMSQKLTKDYKYLILRPNCKLYSQWDTKASLIF